MFWVAYYAKLWIYPVLEVLGWRERLVFLVACWLLMIVCYFVGEFLTNVLWRECYSQHYHSYLVVEKTRIPNLWNTVFSGRCV